MFKNLNPAAIGVSGHQSEIIELALTFGFAGLDLNIAEFAIAVRLKGFDYANRLISSAKLRIGTFPLPIEWDADDATFKKELKKLAEYATCAAQLGCLRCTTVVAAANDKLPYHENFEFHRQRFSEICSVLQPSGVRLAVGFQGAEYLQRNKAFQFIHDFDALSLLVNMVASPNIGLLVDTWDIVAGGGSVESVQKLPPGQIVAVHVADMPAGVAMADLDDKSRLLPGGENGQIDVAAFLSAARALGYDGPVTAKPSRGIFQSRRRDIVIKQTAEALNKVLQAAG